MKAEEARRIVEQAHHLSRLLEFPEWHVLDGYVREAMAVKQRGMVNNGCNSMEEYRFMAGWLAGAQYVLDAAKTTEAGAVRARPFLNKGE